VIHGRVNLHQEVMARLLSEKAEAYVVLDALSHGSRPIRALDADESMARSYIRQETIPTLAFAEIRDTRYRLAILRSEAPC
jgi:hypothetical protein